jgi:hypothetical protein
MDEEVSSIDKIYVLMISYHDDRLLSLRLHKLCVFSLFYSCYRASDKNYLEEKGPKSKGRVT